MNKTKIPSYSNYYSYIGLKFGKIEWIFLAITIISIIGGYYYKLFYWLIIFIPFLFLLSGLYSRKISPFEKQYNIFSKYNGVFFFIKSKFIPFLTGYHLIYFYLIIYEEGIEIRVLFSCFFIPYEKITDIKLKSKFCSLITIKSSLKDVPKVIFLQGVSERAFTIIKKHLKLCFN